MQVYLSPHSQRILNRPIYYSPLQNTLLIQRYLLHQLVRLEEKQFIESIYFVQDSQEVNGV